MGTGMMKMVMKLAGICLILGSSTAIGFFFSRRLEERIEELETIKRLLILLRGEIKYNHATLAEGFHTIGERMKNPYGIILSAVSDEMKRMDGQTLAQIWEKRLREGLKESALSQEDRERLISFGGQLGYLDIEMQQNTIELYLEQVQEEILQARESMKRNGRLYRTMGVVMGIFLVILMV